MGVPVGPRHLVIDFGDDILTLFHNRPGVEGVESEAHISVAVRRRHLQNDAGPARISSVAGRALEKSVGALGRQKICPLRLGDRHQNRAVKCDDKIEGIPVFRLEDFIGSEDKSTHVFDVFEFIFPVGNGVHDQHGRLTQTEGCPETVTGLDDLCSLLG